MKQLKTEIPQIKTFALGGVSTPQDPMKAILEPESKLALRLSLETFGLLRLPVVNEMTGVVLDGREVIRQLRDMGVSQCPLHVVKVSPANEAAARATLQNVAGDWNWKLVSDMLKDLKARGVNPLAAGFHSRDMRPLLAADWTVPPVGDLNAQDGELKLA